MSALSVSTNPLLSQAAQTSQTQATTPDDDQQSQAFASVLKQQQQSQTDKSNSTATSSKQDAAKTDQTQTGDAQNAANASNAKGEDTEANATASDATQTALQQLLPWLQAAQGKASDSVTSEKAGKKSSVTDPTVTDASTALQQAAALAMQAQTSNQAVEGKKDTKDTAADTPATTAPTAKLAAETASTTAKLAADETALVADDKSKSDNSTFNNALNAASTAGQAAQVSQNNAQTAAANTQSTQMHAPLGTPQWQDELGNHVQLMSNSTESRAELVLTPPQLGRIEVSLHVNGDQASATFVSANPDVRNAIQNSMDHLRQVLAGSGISLGQTHVGAESSGQAFANSQGNGQRSGGRASGGGSDNAIPSIATSNTVWTRQSNNMLDVFA